MDIINHSKTVQYTNRLNEKELAKFIGVDSVSFLSFDGMIDAIGVKKEDLCTSCFTGIYPMDIGKKD